MSTDVLPTALGHVIPSRPMADHHTEGDRRRVLVVASQTHHRSNGGLESLTLLLRHLRRSEPCIVTDGHGPYTERWRALGLAVRGPARPVTPTRSRTDAARFAAAVTAACVELRPDVLHCNDIAAFLAAFPVVAVRRTPALLNVRNVKAPGTYGGTWRLARSTARLFVTLSREMEERLERWVPPLLPGRRCPVRHVYSGVERAPSTGPARAALRVSLVGSPEALLICVGAVGPRKRQLTLIEHAGAVLEAAGPGAQLVFLGDADRDDPYVRRCLDAVARLGLTGRVHFRDHVGNMSDWYRAADATLIVSEREGLARAMIESVAHGTPVVSFDVCSAHEVLVERRTGWVVPQGDFVAFAERVRRAVRRERDEDLEGLPQAHLLFSADRGGAFFDETYYELAMRGRLRRDVAE